MYKASSISREEAIVRARSLKKKIDFYERNPTVDDGNSTKFADLYDQIVTQHNLTPDDIDRSPDKTPATSNKFLLKIEGPSTDPVAIWESQPEVKEEMEVQRANQTSRDNDNALPYDIGYNPSTKEFDRQGLTTILKKRKEEYEGQEHPGVHESALEDYIKALAVGMDGEKYKKARMRGVPDEYLMKAFIGSMRPHTIQNEYARHHRDANDTYFSESPAQSAIDEFYENNPSKRRPESSGTDLVSSSGFIPHRFSVIDPIHIVKAYEGGISADDLVEAWHNNGFHPLRNFGSKYTHPITEFIAARGMGIGQDKTKELLSSLKHISLPIYKDHLLEGHSHEDIMDALNPYSKISLELPEGRPSIGTIGANKNKITDKHREMVRQYNNDMSYVSYNTDEGGSFDKTEPVISYNRIYEVASDHAQKFYDEQSKHEGNARHFLFTHYLDAKNNARSAKKFAEEATRPNLF